MDESYVWIVTDAVSSQLEDISTQETRPYYFNGIIGTLPASGKGSDQYKKLKNGYVKQGGDPADLNIYSAMVVEGLRLVNGCLEKLDRTSWDDSPSVDCDSERKWQGGIDLFEAMSEKFAQGNTNHITYDIMNFKPEGYVRIGTWRNTSGLTNNQDENVRWIERDDVFFIGGGKAAPSGFGRRLSGFHLKVGIVQESPIAMLKENCTAEKSSPSCWYGWNPDIVKRLAADLNFTYEFVEQAESKYGAFDEKTKTWTGLVKELYQGEIDLTTVLSINTIRAQYISFTTPIYEDQASIAVGVKSSSLSANMFFFLKPFETSVWISIIVLIIIISVLMTFLSRLSPLVNHHENRSPTNKPCSDCTLQNGMKPKLVEVKASNHAPTDDSIGDQACLTLNNSAWLIGTGEQ